MKFHTWVWENGYGKSWEQETELLPLKDILEEYRKQSDNAELILCLEMVCDKLEEIECLKGVQPE